MSAFSEVEVVSPVVDPQGQVSDNSPRSARPRAGESGQMSQSLFIFQERGRAFDLDETVRVFERIAPGTVRVDLIAAAECVYDESNANVTIRLGSDRGAIVIRGIPPAAPEIAVRLRREFGRDLQLIDDGYNLDLALTESTSEADILDAIDAALA